MNKPLRFNIALGRTKPVNIRNEEVRCPFCDRSKLTDILDTSGHIIWLMFKSVLFFKNHGYMSGGSIRHPHSQIIGLEDYDYHEDITAQNMEGWLLHEDQDVRITLSTQPIIGFFEYNIRFKPDAPVRSVAVRLQQVLRYVLRSIANYSQSYNYFIYNLEDGYDYIKVVARYVTTPLYVGYKIPQTCDEERAAKIIQDIAPYFHASK